MTLGVAVQWIAPITHKSEANKKKLTELEVAVKG